MLAALGQSLVVGELPFGTTGEAGIAFCLKAVAAFAVAGKHLQERPHPGVAERPAVPQIETPRLRLARLTEITRTWHKPKMGNFFCNLLIQNILQRRFSRLASDLRSYLSRDEARVLPASR